VSLSLPVLFTARLGEIMRVVLCVNGHSLTAGFIQQVSNVGGKRRMTAFVFSNKSIVDPHPRLVIYGTKMKQYTPTLGADFEFPLVPTGKMKVPIADATGL
jgi:hypothetical protein